MYLKVTGMSEASNIYCVSFVGNNRMTQEATIRIVSETSRSLFDEIGCLKGLAILNAIQVIINWKLENKKRVVFS